MKMIEVKSLKEVPLNADCEEFLNSIYDSFRQKEREARRTIKLTKKISLL